MVGKFLSQWVEVRFKFLVETFSLFDVRFEFLVETFSLFDVRFKRNLA
jgi:hypothetical protein